MKRFLPFILLSVLFSFPLQAQNLFSSPKVVSDDVNQTISIYAEQLDEDKFRF